MAVVRAETALDWADHAERSHFCSSADLVLEYFFFFDWTKGVGNKNIKDVKIGEERREPFFAVGGRMCGSTTHLKFKSVNEFFMQIFFLLSLITSFCPH